MPTLAARLKDHLSHVNHLTYINLLNLELHSHDLVQVFHCNLIVLLSVRLKGLHSKIMGDSILSLYIHFLDQGTKF